jgi:hypothetical protein
VTTKHYKRLFSVFSTPSYVINLNAITMESNDWHQVLIAGDDPQDALADPWDSESGEYI